MNTKSPSPPLISEAVDNSVDTISTLTPSAPVADVMHAPAPPREVVQSAPEVPAYPAPLPDPVHTYATQDKTNKKDAAETPEEVVKEEEVKSEEASSDTSIAPPSTTNAVTEVETERPSVMLPPSHLETPLESPIAQPEELCLPNGLPLLAPQDPEVPAVSAAERDDSPIAEPDICQGPDIQTPTAITLTASVVQPTPPLVEHPTSTAQETPSDSVDQAPLAQSEVPELVPPVAMKVEEDTPVPQSTTEEEKPSPAETVSIPDSASETVPVSPPSTAEEREDTPPPPPQMVTPTLVETTMQGQINTTYLRNTINQISHA